MRTMIMMMAAGLCLTACASDDALDPVTDQSSAVVEEAPSTSDLMDTGDRQECRMDCQSWFAIDYKACWGQGDLGDNVGDHGCHAQAVHDYEMCKLWCQLTFPPPGNIP